MSDLSGDDLAASILAEVEGPAAPKKASILPTVIAVSILTVVAIGGGAGVGMMLGGKSEPAAEVAEAAPVAEDGEPAKEDGKVPSVIVKLEPVVTTITSPAKTLLRIEASIVIHPDQVENQEVLAAQIQGDTLTFLRTVELAQVEGARGLLHLREDLRERARLRSPAVSDYLIQSLVAQ